MMQLRTLLLSISVAANQNQTLCDLSMHVHVNLVSNIHVGIFLGALRMMWKYDFGNETVSHAHATLGEKVINNLFYDESVSVTSRFTRKSTIYMRGRKSRRVWFWLAAADIYEHYMCDINGTFGEFLSACEIGD